MAKIKNILDSDHVLRCARNKHLVKDHDGKIVDCDHSLFKHRCDDKFIAEHGEAEKSLSVNYIEYFTGTDDERLRQTIIDFRDGQRSKKLSRDASFVKLNVGKFKGLCQSHNAKVRIIHNPTNIKSHGSINQLPQDNALLFDDLCNLAFQNMIRAEAFLGS